MKVFSFLSMDMYVMLLFAWSFFGWSYYYRENSPLVDRNIYWVAVLLVLFFLSALTPLFRYNQNLISTFITMRSNLLIMYLITLLKMYPSDEDILKAIRVLGMLALVMLGMVLLFPYWFVDHKIIAGLARAQKSGSTDFSVAWPGNGCAVLYFYVLLQKMREKASFHNVFWCCVFMGYVFLMQNRSTLICALPFFVYTFLKSDVKYKTWIIGLGSVLIGAYMMTVLSGLIEETEADMSNKNYNRWQAVSFFLLEQDNNLYTVLFGHGAPSAGSAYLAYIWAARLKRLAFISDIGLLGSFFYYGAAMMIVIYRFVLKGITSKKIPLFLKYYCWWILLVPTIHCFGLGNTTSMIHFSLLFYLIIYYDHKDGSICHHRQLQYA
jgi:hypothetical protein